MSDFETWWENNRGDSEYETAQKAYLAGQSSAEQRVKESQDTVDKLRSDLLRYFGEIKELREKVKQLELEMGASDRAAEMAKTLLGEAMFERAALKAQAGEPVAWIWPTCDIKNYQSSFPENDTPLYAAPPDTAAQIAELESRLAEIDRPVRKTEWQKAQEQIATLQAKLDASVKALERYALMPISRRVAEEALAEIEAIK